MGRIGAILINLLLGTTTDIISLLPAQANCLDLDLDSKFGGCQPGGPASPYSAKNSRAAAETTGV